MRQKIKEHNYGSKALRINNIIFVDLECLLVNMIHVQTIRLSHIQIILLNTFLLDMQDLFLIIVIIHQ